MPLRHVGLMLAAMSTACGWWRSVPTEPQTVVLVVLDTVRADHTGLCGDERPITPHLDALAARPRAVSTCRAYSAAPWTHPAHASMLTGRPVEEHGAIWVTGSEVQLNAFTPVRPLAPEFDTVAEAFAARGAQTALLSANVILVPQSGLLQGYQHTRTSKTMRGMRGARLRAALRQLLREVDSERPLFLTVNLYDAHDPYPAVPADRGWLPAQDRLHLEPERDEADNPYVRWVRGASTPEEAAPFLTAVRNGYAEGVFEADANLGVVLDLLRRKGFADHGLRVVVTSDHGEMLGEHRLLRHGGYLYEGMTRVPLVAWDDTRALPALEEPLSTRVVHDLLLHGTVPDLPVTAISERNPDDVLVGVDAAAVWRGASKGWVDAEGPRRTDLGSDPDEAAYAPAPPGPMLDALEAGWQGVQALEALPVPQADPALQDALRSVGYVE